MMLWSAIALILTKDDLLDSCELLESLSMMCKFLSSSSFIT
jgi:hypothetical protein